MCARYQKYANMRVLAVRKGIVRLGTARVHMIIREEPLGSGNHHVQLAWSILSSCCEPLRLPTSGTPHTKLTRTP